MLVDLVLVCAVLLVLLALACAGWILEARSVDGWKASARRWERLAGYYRELYYLERDRVDDAAETIRELVDPFREHDVVRPSLTVVGSEER
jgi:hypothetical protein